MTDYQRLRSFLEIHRAHDVLMAVLNTPRLRQMILGDEGGAEIFGTKVACDVLCWVLCHEEGEFGEFLDNIERAVKEAGYVSLDVGISTEAPPS